MKNPITADEALSFVRVLSRENLPEGFGARLKELIRQGLTPKDAMSQAWREIKLSRTRSKGKKFNPKSKNAVWDSRISIVTIQGKQFHAPTWKQAISIARSNGCVSIEDLVSKVSINLTNRKNPILVYNPPKGGKLLYSKVISIIGYHRSKAKTGTWRHAFSSGVQAIGLKNGDVLLRSTSGRRLWALDRDL